MGWIGRGTATPFIAGPVHPPEDFEQGREVAVSVA